MRSFAIQFAGAHRQVQQDLDVDLVVGGVDARRVVDEVGVDAAAVAGEFDAPALREAQVAALADYLAAEFVAIDPQRVVGQVTDVGIGLAGRLDVGADAAVPQQVHRRFQQGADQRVGRQVILLHTQPGLDFRA